MAKRFLYCLLLVGLLGSITACESEILDDADSLAAEGTVVTMSMDGEVTQYPQAIQLYIAENYNGLFIISISQEQEDGTMQYEVILNDGTKLYFGDSGNFINENTENDNLALSDLPTAAISYINTYYAGIAIDRIRQKSNGYYEVEFENNVKISFDANGNLITEEGDTDLSIADLPPAILAYIAAVYPSATISEAEIHNNNTYEVRLNNGTKLYFDAEGEILYQESSEGEWWEDDDDTDTPINIQWLPETISNYIAEHYPSATVIIAEVETNGDYEIRLNNGVKLYFNALEAFLYEENEFELVFSSLQFPDTVTIGETAVMSGYIVNQSIYPFGVDDIGFVYGVEDEMPANLNAVVADDIINIANTTIPPNDSIPFSVNIPITANRFLPGADITVIWPDVPTSINPIIIGGGRKTIATFVFP